MKYSGTRIFTAAIALLAARLEIFLAKSATCLIAWLAASCILSPTLALAQTHCAISIRLS